MKRFLLSLAVSLMLLAAPMFAVVSPVSADEWSDEDPVVLIVTPRGNLVPVYNTMGVYGVQYAPAIALAQVNYSVAPAKGGAATAVTLSVTIPNSLLGSGFPTRTTISSGPMGTLKIYGRATGTSGSPMTVKFNLNVP